MNKANRITDSEWLIMEVVWREGKLRASDVIRSINRNNETSWSDKTIRTLIDRLVSKKILGKVKENVNMYYPLLSEEECIREVTDTFMKKVYKGSLGLLVSNFAKNNNLTDKDVTMLRQLLLDKEKKNYE